MFFGWGTKTITYPLADGRRLVYRYDYFHLFFFPIASNEHWYVISDNRAEDTEISFEAAAQLYPTKRPRLGQFGRFGLLYGISAVVLLSLLGVT